MRRLLLLTVALLLVSVDGWAQSCDGCGIGYRQSVASGGAGVFLPLTGGTLTGPLLLPDGSAAAPSLSFANDTDKGFFSSGSTMLFANNTARIAFTQTQLQLNSTHSLAWSSSTPDGTSDVLLTRDAANTLALRNGTNTQTFNIYNTYTDGSNYERTTFAWSSNQFYIQVQAAGSGTLRTLNLGGGGKNWKIDATGSFYPGNNDEGSLGTASLAMQHVYALRSIQGSKSKALTESSATTVATVAVPQTAGTNFAAGEVRYTVYATDGTDTQVLNGSAFFSALNKAGTETCTITDDQIASEAASTGTLTCTLACAVGLTDVVGITFDCASSLTQSTLNALVRFDMQQPNTLVFP